MKIGGIQKLTLLDYPGFVACTIFTNGCNMRCPFCHNATLAKGQVEQLIPENEIYDFLKKRVGILDGVCITGGEPLINKNIFDFIENIRSFGYKIKLDTNGSFPDRLEEILKAGIVDYVAVDIKNSRKKYPLTVGIGDFDIFLIDNTINLLANSGIEYEFRTTAVKGLHEASDFEKIGEWLNSDMPYFIQNFTDSGDIMLPGCYSGFKKEELEQFLAAAKKHLPNAKLRGVD